MHQILTQLENHRVVPVVALESVAMAERVADALAAGGLPCAEITLRTPAAVEIIAALAKREHFLVGAGTVHNPEQARQVVEAGAKFVVAPGFNPKTVNWCLDHDVPVFPGVCTPTDLEQALDVDLQVVKFFPAEAMGGVRTLQALHGPYHTLRFMPTGGITLANLSSYLVLPYVVACGGSWMVNSSAIAAGRFDEITERTRDTLRLACELRPAQ